ncbi:MAG: hypothetical protein WC860_07520 [Candidatus Margulisiibacteriota bacterium]|jgi:cellulose biosynthesis protein BcsQ
MLKILIVDENPRNIQCIKKELLLHIAEIEIISEFSRAVQYLENFKVDILFVNVNLISRFLHKNLVLDDVYSIVIGDVPEPEYLRLAMLFKASDLIFQPLLPDIINQAFNKAKNIMVEFGCKRNTENKTAKIVNFFSILPEIGQTSISLRLAFKLATLNKFNVLWTDLTNDSNLIKIFADKTENVTYDEIKDVSKILKIDSLKLLLIDEQQLNSDVNLFSLLNKLKKRFDYIIIDSPKCFSNTSLVVLNLSNIIYYLTSLEKAQFDDSLINFNSLKKLNINNEAINILVNKYENCNNTYTKKEAEELMKNKIQIILPKIETYDKIKVSEFINNNTPDLVTQKLDLLLDSIIIQGV